MNDVDLWRVRGDGIGKCVGEEAPAPAGETPPAPPPLEGRREWLGTATCKFVELAPAAAWVVLLLLLLLLLLSEAAAPASVCEAMEPSAVLLECSCWLSALCDLDARNGERLLQLLSWRWCIGDDKGEAAEPVAIDMSGCGRGESGGCGEAVWWAALFGADSAGKSPETAAVMVGDAARGVKGGIV
jgi:hypothetical protein